MPDLSDLDMLVKAWRTYVGNHVSTGFADRDEGFSAALTVCANQLAETLERMRADA